MLRLGDSNRPLRRELSSTLVEYERNMAERTWQEVGANRAEETVREEFDSYRAHHAMAAHVEARIVTFVIFQRTTQ